MVVYQPWLCQHQNRALLVVRTLSCVTFSIFGHACDSVFSHAEHEAVCCFNTMSRRGRLTGSIKRRAMTSPETRGLLGLTLKHTKQHTLPQSSVKYKLLLLYLSLPGESLSPHNSGPHLAHQYTAMASVHLVSFFLPLNLLLWSKMCHIASDIWLKSYTILQCRGLIFL